MLNIFCVHDAKAQAYITPFYLPQPGQATRAFADAANDQNHQFGRHPEDYTLFHLGKFDETNCVYNLFPTPQPLGKAIDFLYPRSPSGDQLDMVTQIQEEIGEQTEFDNAISDDTPVQSGAKRGHSA